MRKRFGIIRSILLPILVAIYPVIFLYSVNAEITTIDSLVTTLLIMIPLALALVALFWIFQRNFIHAGLSAVVFLAFFHTYGALYTRLLISNRVQVEHYTLLPLVVVVAFYGAFFVHKLNLKTVRSLQDILLLVTGALVLYNIIIAVPAELEKSQKTLSVQRVEAGSVAKADYPDIYFIIFDEYAGFEALAEYWQYDGYQEFVSFLEDNGFFVAMKSHSPTADTLHEISSRLNLISYVNPVLEKDKKYRELFDAIADNKVMRLLKSYGYTTVVFDGPSIAYDTKTPIIADYSFMYDGSETKGADEFTSLFLGQTMIRVFPNAYVPQNPERSRSRGMILYSLDKAADLEEIQRPKFVYLHVMLPHLSIQFDEFGNPLDTKLSQNWAFYLPQLKYATKRAQQLVGEILADYDPKHPPVIILQSDHGARNHTVTSANGYNLKNYDDKYKTSILNAVLLPEYDYNQFTDDLSPIEPLKIALNYYLGAGVDIVTIDESKQ